MFEVSNTSNLTAISEILKKMKYYAIDMIVQKAADGEGLKNEIRLGNGIIIVTVTAVDLQEIVKSGGTVY